MCAANGLPQLGAPLLAKEREKWGTQPVQPNYNNRHDYSTAEIDLFAAYRIPEDLWYFLPSYLLLGPHRRTGVMLCPMVPLKKNRYSFESYKSLAAPRQKQTRFGLFI